MSLERREKVIDDRSYQMIVPSVRTSMPLCTTLAAALGPLLSNINAQATADNLAGALGSIDPNKVDKLLMDAMKGAHLCFKGEPISDEINFERHFNAHRADTYPILIWCLWESVKDFFPQLGAFTQTIKKAVEEASLSPQAGA